MSALHFKEEQITEGKFQWFIDIVVDLKFITGETVRPRESQIDEMHATKFMNTKDQSIDIYYLKTEKSTEPLTLIRNIEP